MSLVADKFMHEKKCYTASHDWFYSSGEDFTLEDGVSVGKVIQLQVFEKLFEEAQVNADRVSIKSIIKRMNLEWATKSIMSFFSRKGDVRPSRILFIYDVNNDPMIDALNIIGNTLIRRHESISAVVVDSNIESKCKIERKLTWFACFLFFDIFGVLRKGMLRGSIRSQCMSESFDNLKEYFGLRKAKIIRRYFNFQFYQVLLEVKALKSLLGVKKPEVVVLASDAHRVSRIVVFLCKKLKIKTVVYQHGATIWEYGYVPVYADKMLVWGGTSRSWFEKRGVEQERLVEVGNLRSDVPGVVKLDKNEFTASRKVYFFPNPIDRKVTGRVITMFLNICQNYGMEGVLKLHPSEKNVSFFESRISKVLPKVSISVDPINEVGIAPGDIAIVINSTAGIDACLLGACIFNVIEDSMPNPIEYEDFGVGVKTTTSNYNDDFERLLEIPASLYFHNREEFIRSYMGELDGKSSDRACDAILDLAKKSSYE